MSTIWMWVKRIAWGIIAVGAAIIGIFLFTKKGGSDSIEDLTHKAEQGEQTITSDLEKDKKKVEEIKAQEEAIKKEAEDAKKKAEENISKPEQPGDAGKAGEDFKNSW